MASREEDRADRVDESGMAGPEQGVVLTGGGKSLRVDPSASLRSPQDDKKRDRGLAAITRAAPPMISDASVHEANLTHYVQLFGLAPGACPGSQ
jgi:hypothetical protein